MFFLSSVPSKNVIADIFVTNFNKLTVVLKISLQDTRSARFLLDKFKYVEAYWQVKFGCVGFPLLQSFLHFSVKNFLIIVFNYMRRVWRKYKI